MNGSSAPYFYENNWLIELECDDFLRFVNFVEISRNFEHLQDYANKGLLVSLTKLCLFDIDLNKNVLLGLANIRNNMKHLQMYALDFNFDTSKNSFFDRTYPMLSDFIYFSYIEMSSSFKSFLERNPTIKRLHIKYEDLQKIPFNTSTLRLDCLTISTTETIDNGGEWANQLKALHANGYYNTLHILDNVISGSNEFGLFLNEMTSFSAFEVLYTCRFHTNICRLTQLKELHILELNRQTGFDLEAVAKNLINLERLWIECTVGEILSFLRYSKKLRMVVWENGTIPANALNLFHLNEMRRTGGMQRKVQNTEKRFYSNIFLY